MGTELNKEKYLEGHDKCTQKVFPAESEKWTEEIFPGIYRIGNDASDTGGNQAVLIDEDGYSYLIFTDGSDYGSWLGSRYKLTAEGREQVMNWKDGSYSLSEWLRKMEGE